MATKQDTKAGFRAVETTAATKSDAGMKNNEDCAFVTIDDSGIILAVVADGVGGLNKGEIASRYITKSIEHWFEESISEIKTYHIEEVASAMEKVTHRIHEELLDISDEEGIEFGSTMTFIILGRTKYAISQIGDSRAYLFSGEQVQQLTKDQTVAEYERDTGNVVERVPEERKEHVLMQCMGSGQIEPVVETGELPKAFKLLLCSDGMSNTLSDQDLIGELKKKVSCTKNLKNLINLARSREETDNITGILIRKAEVSKKKKQ